METKTIAHDNGIKDPAVVSRQKWLSARTAFLVKDKEFTRLRDERPELGRRLQELGRTDASTQRLRGGEEPWSSLDGKVRSPTDRAMHASAANSVLNFQSLK